MDEQQRFLIIPGEDLGRGILKKLLNDIEISRDEFLDWLHKKNK